MWSHGYERNEGPAKDLRITEGDGPSAKANDDPDTEHQAGLGRRTGRSLRDPEPAGFFSFALIERSRGGEETAPGAAGVLPGRGTGLREDP